MHALKDVFLQEKEKLENKRECILWHSGPRGRFALCKGPREGQAWHLSCQLLQFLVSWVSLS